MKSLFVGNLAFQTTEGDLRAVFEPFGQIERIHLLKDRETGRARGFGFVEMASDDQAKRAIAALDGKEVGGRNIKVVEARPREQSGPPRQGDRNSRGARERERHAGSSKDSYEGAARQPREPRW